MWIVWSGSEAQRCCKAARFLYCLGSFIVKYWPYKSYKSWHTCPTISLRMSTLFSLILYLKSRTFMGKTQYIWPIYCGSFCFTMWREQWALDQLGSEMFVLQCHSTNRSFASQHWIYWHELVCTVFWWSHTFHPMTFLTFSWFPSCRNTSAVKCPTLLNKLGISSSWLIWYVFTLVDFSTLLAIELPSCLHKYDFIISFV